MEIGERYRSSQTFRRRSHHSIVKSAGVSVLLVCASTCFQLRLKACTKRCTNNSLSSRDKIFFFLHVLIDQVLLISEYDLENETIPSQQRY